MKQYDIYGGIVEVGTPTSKVKYSYSVYAVPKYYDGVPTTGIVSAYSAEQAKYLFEKYHSGYRAVDAYRI